MSWNARRAERFAALVDRAPGSPTEPVEDRWDDLLVAVGALRAVAHTAPEPRPEFVADLRERLMLEADTVLAPTEERLLLPHTRSSRRPARLVAASAALVLAGGTAGVAVAAEHSLPGESLYTLKQGLETIDRGLQLSDADRGRAELGQAGARLDEVRALLARGDTDPVATTLQRFRSSAGSGSDRLFTAYQADGDEADVTAVRSFAAAAMQQVEDLSAGATPTDQAQFEKTAAMLSALDQEAQVLCPGCGSAEALQPPADLSAAPADTTALGLPAASTVAAQGEPQSGVGQDARALARAAGKATALPGSGQSTGTVASQASAVAGAVSSKGASAEVTSVAGAVGTVVGGAVGTVTGTVKDTASGTVKGTVDGVTGAVKGTLGSVTKGGGGKNGASSPTATPTSLGDSVNSAVNDTLGDVGGLLGSSGK